jgi:membrane associated rhomboid family serine protease
VHIIIPALTYNGSVFDTALNAVVLVILITALAVQSRSTWWITLVAMVVLQVVLWFALEASGISVVWSGLAGAALVDLVERRLSSRRGSAPARLPHATDPEPRQWVLATAVGIAAAAMVFYAVALPPITTVAHVLALVVGAGIDALTRRVTHRRANRRARKVTDIPGAPVPFRLPERLHKKMLEKWPDYNEFDDELHYGIWGDAGLLITREKEGYRVDRRADRSNYYDQFRFRTTSRRTLERRLLQE